MTDDAPRLPDEIQQFTTKAKRHHYVPEFLLRRFSTNPRIAHPPIYQLDVQSGTVSRPNTRDCTVIRDYNTLFAAPMLPVGYIEALFTATESSAAPVIERLLTKGDLDIEGMVNLAAFVYIQQQRTPRGREWTRFALDQGATAWLLKQIYENRGISEHALTAKLGRPPTEDELATYIRELAEPIERGEMQVQTSRDDEVMAMLSSAAAAIPLITEMHWKLIHAPDGAQFILSDDPVVRHDPNNPNGPAGWRSTPTVNVSLPLDPKLCLLLEQSPPLTYAHTIASQEEVLDVNLRTLAGARKQIFGTDEALLQTVWAAAKGDPGLGAKYTPKPPRFHVLDGRAGGDEVLVKTQEAPRTYTIRRGKRAPAPPPVPE